MDLIVNPALNNTVSPASKPLSTEELTEAQGFSKVFSDMTDLSKVELQDDGTVKPIESSEENKVYQSFSQQFGPPLGVDIEGFDYS